MLNCLLVYVLIAAAPEMLSEPKLITKKDEVVYLETLAALMKEVAIREWRGGSSGVSFRRCERGQATAQAL